MFKIQLAIVCICKSAYSAKPHSFIPHNNGRYPNKYEKKIYPQFAVSFKEGHFFKNIMNVEGAHINMKKRFSTVCCIL